MNTYPFIPIAAIFLNSALKAFPISLLIGTSIGSGTYPRERRVNASILVELEEQGHLTYCFSPDCGAKNNQLNLQAP